jgi:hypothetical protein
VLRGCFRVNRFGIAGFALNASSIDLGADAVAALWQVARG